MMDVIRNLGGVEPPAMFGKLAEDGNVTGSAESVQVPNIVAAPEPEAETASAD